MTGFALSPGITPLITDIAVAGLPLVLAAGVVVGGERGVPLSLGLVTLALAVVKAVTDYRDLWDDVVALAGLGIGLAGIGRPWVSIPDTPRAGRGWTAVGIAAILVGLYKAGSDFYDPFDLELATLTVALALVLIASIRTGWGGPAVGSAPRATP